MEIKNLHFSAQKIYVYSSSLSSNASFILKPLVPGKFLGVARDGNGLWLRYENRRFIGRILDAFQKSQEDLNNSALGRKESRIAPRTSAARAFGSLQSLTSRRFMTNSFLTMFLFQIPGRNCMTNQDGRQIKLSHYENNELLGHPNLCLLSPLICMQLFPFPKVLCTNPVRPVIL